MKIAIALILILAIMPISVLAYESPVAQEETPYCKEDCAKDNIDCRCKDAKDYYLCVYKIKCSMEGQSKEEVVKCVCENHPNPKELRMCKPKIETTTTTITTTTTTEGQTTTTTTPAPAEKKKARGINHTIYIGKIIKECHEFEGKIYKFITLVGINKTLRLNKVCEE